MCQSQLWLEGCKWSDLDTLPSGVEPPQTSFECLGTLAFEGKTYSCYRTSDDPQTRLGKGEITKREARGLRQQPTLWRTIPIRDDVLERARSAL
jgi:hypothetical protein